MCDEVGSTATNSSDTLDRHRIEAPLASLESRSQKMPRPDGPHRVRGHTVAVCLLRNAAAAREGTRHVHTFIADCVRFEADAQPSVLQFRLSIASKAPLKHFCASTRAMTCDSKTMLPAAMRASWSTIALCSLKGGTGMVSFANRPRLK